MRWFLGFVVYLLWIWLLGIPLLLAGVAVLWLLAHVRW